MKSQSSLRNNSFFKEFGIAKIQTDKFIQNQKEAAKVYKDTLYILNELIIKETALCLLDLDKIAEDNILKHKAVPVFKNYKGFPQSLCISINNCLLHGVAKQNQKLNYGDKITIDFGVMVDGGIVDAARTWIFGQTSDAMIVTAMLSLKECSKNFKPKDQLGKIGYIINKIVSDNNFQVIDNYGGHGISHNCVHDFPFVCNKGNFNEGVRIYPGMSIAIEPILLPKKSSKEIILDKEDKWSLYSKEIGVHCEDTFLMTDDGLLNLTSIEG